MMQVLYVKLNPGFRCKSEIQKGEGSFHQQIGIKLKEKLVRCYIWNIALYYSVTLTLREVDQK
jgi:hypothetical protein